MKKNPHVVPNRGQWAVKFEKQPKPESTHRTQRAAIEAARQLAKKTKSELSIHGEDGRIRAKDSYGNDEFPPRG